jgi:hypothetical protein
MGHKIGRPAQVTQPNLALINYRPTLNWKLGPDLHAVTRNALRVRLVECHFGWDGVIPDIRDEFISADV